jgi:hypothetical protein
MIIMAMVVMIMTVNIHVVSEFIHSAYSDDDYDGYWANHDNDDYDELVDFLMENIQVASTITVSCSTEQSGYRPIGRVEAKI